MAATSNYIVLAALAAYRPLSGVLAVGLFALFVLLTVLVWTRFGQARPIAKCVVLSLLAHLLLLIYAYSTHILYGPPGRWTGQTVTVRLRDAADDVEAAPPEAERGRQAGYPGADDEHPPLFLCPSPGEQGIGRGGNSRSMRRHVVLLRPGQDKECGTTRTSQSRRNSVLARPGWPAPAFG